MTNKNESELTGCRNIDTWTKEEYLGSKHVVGLINYIANLEKSTNLNHGYDVKYPAWRKWLKDKKRNTYVSISSLSQAFGEYFWVAQDECTEDKVASKSTSFEGNTAILNTLSSSLKHSVKNNNEEATFLSCIKILEWGQVFKGSVKWTIDAYEQHKLCRKISDAVKFLDGENASGLQDFKTGKSRIDSGLTKIYSLASEKSIIYDDRVGAALSFLAKKYLETLQNYKDELPLELNFMPGRAKGRDPSDAIFKFEGRGKNPSYVQARSNLMANWLVGGIVSKLDNPVWDRRSVEAALFMVGYRV